MPRAIGWSCSKKKAGLFLFMDLRRKTLATTPQELNVGGNVLLPPCAGLCCHCRTLTSRLLPSTRAQPINVVQCSNVATLGVHCMAITKLSSREFNQDTSKAKRAAKKGPVFITDRGHPPRAAHHRGVREKSPVRRRASRICWRCPKPPQLNSSHLACVVIFTRKWTCPDVPPRYQCGLRVTEGDESTSKRQNMGSGASCFEPILVCNFNTGTGDGNPSY